MKERPILFSGVMVRAILDGCKTQTRRVVKQQVFQLPEGEGMTEADFALGARLKYLAMTACPYGVPGDRLWVRETWTPGDTDGESWVDIGYRADDASRQCAVREEQADEMRDLVERLEVVGNGGMNWRASIHMPRWASRITLQITEVRVQRLKEISDEDAQAEGFHSEDRLQTARFHDMWDRLNAKRGLGWDMNPWVWAISFEVAK